MTRKPPIVPPGPAFTDMPGCDLDSAQTQAMTKMTVRIGNANRSNTCTRLCPKNAMSSCAATTITRQSVVDRLVNSTCRASAPLTLLTANQPIPATSELMPAGR